MLKGSVANSVSTCLLPPSCKSSGLQNQPLKMLTTAPKWHPKRLYSMFATDPLSLVLRHEGGYIDHLRDPGGATNLGVTIGTLSAYLGRSGRSCRWLLFRRYRLGKAPTIICASLSSSKSFRRTQSRRVGSHLSRITLRSLLWPCTEQSSCYAKPGRTSQTE
jgi:hypothetical protein